MTEERQVQIKREWTGILLLIIFGLGLALAKPCDHSREVFAIRGSARERLQRQMTILQNDAASCAGCHKADAIEFIQDALNKKERIR